MDFFEPSDYIEELEENLKKAYTYLYNEFINIRAGRANPHILDKIRVDYYGNMSPINQLSNIAVPDARTLTISVWDQSIIKDVIKALQESDIGINPIYDGKIIRLNFPILTEERRKELVKEAKKITEEQKVQMRNARRDCMESMKALKKEGNISEDEYARYEKQIQDILDKNIAKLDNELSIKEKEIMEI